MNIKHVIMTDDYEPYAIALFKVAYPDFFTWEEIDGKIDEAARKWQREEHWDGPILDTHALYTKLSRGEIVVNCVIVSLIANEDSLITYRDEFPADYAWYKDLQTCISLRIEHIKPEPGTPLPGDKQE